MTARHPKRKDALAAVDLMDATGLSVAKLAERLKWSQRNLYYYRSGEPMPPHIRFALKWLAQGKE